MFFLGKPETPRWKVSATQVRKFQECPRAWGYTYIEDLRSEPGRGAQLGSDVHDDLEQYFKFKRDIDPSTESGRIAKRALAHVPMRSQPDLMVEEPFWFDLDGVIYRGFIDLAWLEEDVPVVQDYKTSSNPKRYGLKQDELKHDVQALTYAFWATGYHESTSVALQWTYLDTKKVDSFAVETELAVEYVKANFLKKVHPTGLKIVEAVRSVDRADALDANPSACGMYGGCPHAEYCPRSTSETITAIFGGGEKSVGLADIVKSKKKPRNRDNSTGNVVEMPGQRINSPEAPASTEVAKAISQSSNPKKAAVAAAGAKTKEEAEEQINEALSVTVGRPKDWDPSETPTQDQVLAWVCSGTFRKFIPQKVKASETIPFAHGRSLSAMNRAGLISHKNVKGLYEVQATEAGWERFRKLKNPEVWVDDGDQPASLPGVENLLRDEETVQIQSTTQKTLAVQGWVEDGKLVFEIDLGAFR